jgi:hypothetical protein
MDSINKKVILSEESPIDKIRKYEIRVGNFTEGVNLSQLVLRATVQIEGDKIHAHTTERIGNAKTQDVYIPTRPEVKENLHLYLCAKEVAKIVANAESCEIIDKTFFGILEGEAGYYRRLMAERDKV